MRVPSLRNASASSRMRRLRLGQVVVAESDVQQVDVPRQLHSLHRRRSRRSRARSAASCSSSRRARRDCRPAAASRTPRRSSRSNSSGVNRSPAFDARRDRRRSAPRPCAAIPTGCSGGSRRSPCLPSGTARRRCRRSRPASARRPAGPGRTRCRTAARRSADRARRERFAAPARAASGRRRRPACR